MGSWSELVLSTRPFVAYGETEHYLQDTVLSYKYGIAPAWFSLFDRNELVINGDRNSEDSDFCAYLVTDISSARKRYAARRAKFAEVLGELWTRSADNFGAYLDDSRASFAILDMTEFTEMYEDFSDFTAMLDDSFRAFELPILSGKKHLFSRKPKLTPEWKGLVDVADYYAGRPGGDQAWTVFGAGHDRYFDPPGEP
ncbi:MAG: hypothetical protein QNJ00_01605 [Woeseiaceae bacterium]|nr:hypothetical protein [Woeseiaceae bacterium]